MVYFTERSEFPGVALAERTALAAVRQWPMLSCTAIQPHVIVVSARSLAAMRALVVRGLISSHFRQAARRPRSPTRFFS